MEINMQKKCMNVYIFIRTVINVTNDKSIIFPAVTFIG